MTQDIHLKDPVTLSDFQSLYRALREIETIAGSEQGMRDNKRIEKILKVASSAAASVRAPVEAKV